MTKSHPMRTLLAGFALSAAMATTASAQISGINFVATTSFKIIGGTSCTGSCNTAALAGTGYTASSQTLGGLTLTGGGFNILTHGVGYVSIGGGGQNFGIADVAQTTFTYTNQIVFMKVTFTSPVGSQTEIWKAILQGTGGSTPSGFAAGGFGMNWVHAGSYPSNNNFNTYTYGALPGHPYGGVADFDVNANNINTTAAASGQQISGYIQVEDFLDNDPPPGTAPEPASMVLIASGLLGIGAIARRRRASKKS